MSLNWKEIQLILQEEDITGSKIQAVVQNSFHSLTWEMYSRERQRFSYYTEVGTDTSRLHLLSPNVKYQKTKKIQRFVQFARKNLEGSIITKVEQLPFDRCVVWYLNNHDRILKIYIRLFSGPGANIIVTDQNDIILDLLLRRPGRDEISGGKLSVEIKSSEPDRDFQIRPYEGNFNFFIEQSYREKQLQDSSENLKQRLEAAKEHELMKILGSIRSAQRTIEENANFEEIKSIADLLASNVHLFKQGDASVNVTDWNTGKVFAVPLNRSLKPGDNVQFYYGKYQRVQGTFNNAKEELERLNNEYKATEEKFNSAMDDPEKAAKLLENTVVSTTEHTGPGLRCTSGGFEILVGRNAKENDELLRHYAKGNDMWMHTRDFPGGYVFIKYKRDKSIPLEVLLDGANLAVNFSKGRNSDKVDLYYTQVRYLRRAKNGKTGLVLPTQEKNLTIKPDKSRINRLLPQ